MLKSKGFVAALARLLGTAQRFARRNTGSYFTNPTASISPERNSTVAQNTAKKHAECAKMRWGRLVGFNVMIEN